MRLSEILAIRAERYDYGNSIGVAILVEKDGRRYFAQPVVFNTDPQQPEAYSVEPTVTLSIEAAQRLLDDLWRCGLRPTERDKDTGALSAVTRHLEDMRRIAFAKLAIGEPKP